MKKIVFYDHNFKICTCFKNWAEKRSSYWEFLPNDEKSILDSGIDIDLSIPPKKIVCNDDELFFGAIAILKIFSKCGGKISKLSKFFLRIKILYFLYNFSYYLFSRNRSRFSFMIPYINC